MPKQPALYRVRFIVDPDAQFEECNGEARPLTRAEYAENQYMQDGKPVSYKQYRAYYGNPERHVYLQCEVQKGCPCCGSWTTVGGTGSIDFMDDSPELEGTLDRWIPEAEINELPGYLAEIAREDLDDARANE